ncbi:hypothetical protein ABC304_16270 [Microbacterium sp. 1P10UB]|uniref:hypothetical protein n=1 Tax=unclassified Microbacterium TaxID=2609290 RepID=UPI0039A39315
MVLLLGATAAGTWLFLQLTEARQQIDDRNDRIDEQDDQIEEQQEQLDKKEEFGAAMAGLQSTIAPLAGLPFAQLVPWSDYDLLAARAWSQRRDIAAMDRIISDVEGATAELADMQEAARAQAADNASGSAWEATLDQLGGGWVATSIDDVSVSCEGDVLACVNGSDPYVVHIDAASASDEAMTDWIRTGVAYHEFAHVLQFLNPDATAAAEVAFGGDWETMADCYALTVLPGWSLDHNVPINEYEYWEISVGYGYTCDESQRQTIRDWTAQLGFEQHTIAG